MFSVTKKKEKLILKRVAFVGWDHVSITINRLYVYIYIYICISIYIGPTGKEYFQDYIQIPPTGKYSGKLNIPYQLPQGLYHVKIQGEKRVLLKKVVFK